MKYPFRIPKAFLDNEGDLHMGRLVKALRRAEHQNDREEIARLLKLKRRIDRARIAAAESEVPGSSPRSSVAPSSPNWLIYVSSPTISRTPPSGRSSTGQGQGHGQCHTDRRKDLADRRDGGWEARPLRSSAHRV